MRPAWILAFVVAVPYLISHPAGAASRPRPQNPDDGRTVSGVQRGAQGAVLPYNEGFETGGPGWLFDGKWHVRTNPQTTRVSDFIRNTPLVVLPDAGFWPNAYEGTNVLVYSDDAAGTAEEGTFVAPWDPGAQSPYNGGTSTGEFGNAGNAVSPTIDLQGYANATLRVRFWYEIESVDPAPEQFDAMLIGISTDGVNFSDIGYAGPAVDYNGEAYEPATSGGFNVPGVWVQQIFDLSAYVGSMVNLRFRFQTNDELYNAYRGWFVDAVEVNGDTLAGCTIDRVDPNCAAPGDIVRIYGSNFQNSSSVFIGGQPATPSSVLSSNIIECTVPSLPDGMYGVVVTPPGGGPGCSQNDAILVLNEGCPTPTGRETWGRLKTRYR